jgi:electron transfer flavoprotein beta subunit
MTRIVVLLRRLRARPDAATGARIIGACDQAALRAALALKVGAGVTVTALAAGPAEREDEALRLAMAAGVDRAFRVDDSTLNAMDYYGLARALAGAIKHQGFDLVLTGDRSEDEGQGAVGPAVAELLGVLHLGAARRVTIVDKEVRATRREAGIERTLALPLPALVAVAAHTGGALVDSGAQKPITVLDLATIGLSAPELKHREPLLGRPQPVRLSRNATLVGPEELVVRLREERLLG